MKSEKAYKSISEVAKILNLIDDKTGKLNTHTIRFWEKEFKQIKPKLFSGKRRYYDEKSIDLLKNIKFLLKDQGFTINGVKIYFINNESLNLDENLNNSIKSKILLKNKVDKISKLIKELKNKNGKKNTR